MKVTVCSLPKLSVPTINVVCMLRAPEHFFKIYNLNKGLYHTYSFCCGQFFHIKNEKNSYENKETD